MTAPRHSSQVTARTLRQAGVGTAVVMLVAVAVASSGLKPVLRTATPLNCSVVSVSEPFVAEARPGQGGFVPVVDVTFSKRRPSPLVAERILRQCLQAATLAYSFNRELLAQAWFRPPGSSETLLPLSDGSIHLTFDPHDGRVRTWDEREHAAER